MSSLSKQLGPYSRRARTVDWLIVSGQVGLADLRPSSWAGGVEAELRKALGRNLGASTSKQRAPRNDVEFVTRKTTCSSDT